MNSLKNCLHNFIGFMKAFDILMDYGLLHIFGIQHESIVMIKALYDNSTSEVLFDNTQCFTTIAVGVIQGCLQSTNLFNVFIEEIMTEIQSTRDYNIPKIICI